MSCFVMKMVHIRVLSPPKNYAQTLSSQALTARLMLTTRTWKRKLGTQFPRDAKTLIIRFQVRSSDITTNHWMVQCTRMVVVCLTSSGEWATSIALHGHAMQLARLLPAVRGSFVVCIVFSDCSSTVSGMVPPAFGVLYAKGINGFSDIDPHQRRHDGDRTALWFFIIALISTCMIGLQYYMFGSAAATLTAKVRSLSFKAILRQDSKFWPYKSTHLSSDYFYSHSRILRQGREQFRWSYCKPE
jgi:hypothetical protein